MTTRREQVREAITRHRKRHKRGLFVRPIIVTKTQLDQLEERGYLNPGDRGNRADECEAIANFPLIHRKHRCTTRRSWKYAGPPLPRANPESLSR
jgi:hypothetical protein